MLSAPSRRFAAAVLILAAEWLPSVRLKAQWLVDIAVECAAVADQQAVAVPDSTYQMIYPESRRVSAAQLIGWAQDVLCDEEEVPAASVENLSLSEAIDCLTDRGLVTLGNQGKPLNS